MQHTASTVQKLRETKMTFFKRNVNVNANANTTVRRSSNETDAKSASADCPLPGNDYEYDANSVTGGGAVVGDGTLITVRDDDSDGGDGGYGGGGGRFAKRSFFRFPGRRSSNRSSRANEASVSSSRNDDLDDLHDDEDFHGDDLHDSDDEDDSDDDDDGNRSGNYPCVHLSPPPPPKSSRQNSLFSLENSIAELVGDDADDGASVAPSIDKYGFVHDGPDDDDDCGGRRPVADAVDLDVAIDMDGDRASVLTSNSSLRDAASSTTLSHAPSHASHRSGRGLRATALPAHQHHHQHLLRTKVTGVPKRRIHKNFARQGIADDARRKAWMAIPNVDEVVARNRGRYDLLVERAAAEILELTAKRERGAGGGTNGGDDDPLKRGRRRSALDEDPSRKIHSLDWWDTLERDLGRTFPKHLLFRHLKDFKGVGDRVRPDGSRANHFGGDNAQLFRTGRDGLLDDATQPQPQQLQPQQQQQPQQDDDDNRSDAFEQVAKFAVESTGQAALRRLLRAYSTHDPQVGYCQGMNFIAALFLMVMDDEETAFWMFVSVMTEDVYNLRELFLRDMAGTQEVLYVAERLIQQFLPRLFEHFQQQNVQMSMILTPWLMTIYTRNFPFDLVLRVWDSFLVEGWKVVYRTMLALLEHAQPALLQLEFEEIVMYLREFTSGIDGPNIMLASLKISLRRKHILKYVAEWKGLSEKGETRTVDTGVFNRLNTRGSEVVSSMGFGSFVDT